MMKIGRIEGVEIYGCDLRKGKRTLGRVDIWNRSKFLNSKVQVQQR